LVVDGTAGLEVSELVATVEGRSGAPDLSMAAPTEAVRVVGAGSLRRRRVTGLQGLASG
jgi:hypothetical protein